MTKIPTADVAPLAVQLRISETINWLIELDTATGIRRGHSDCSPRFGGFRGTLFLLAIQAFPHFQGIAETAMMNGY